ncbi:Piso0_001765 [Millerozyma farinosa CBS 7064]|uniref:Large ribosomal subunit protein mL38 n=1 Tax=Pichia sorbitophila (strain ATCC MYA-4447 / BCRC 22081 / CBS 7064 / NBRC 10061 / NRRL Y-12695) TaxID=559304 RepID=G8YP15_PICSO|nr:Piso0_001765 [Millerozyma farinosa CBS 7064]
MLQRNILRQSVKGMRTFGSHGPSYGVWSNRERPAALKLKNDEAYRDLMNKIEPGKGPASIKNMSKRWSYHSPLLIDETFKAAYDLLEQESEKCYNRIDEIKKQLEQGSSADDSAASRLREELATLEVDAEKYNPEVLYNVEYFPESVDWSLPVYRKYLEQKWKEYDLPVTMQRLEQLHVIPDTMPTLDPKANVKVKFGHNTEPELAGWITPGRLLPSFAVSSPPTISVQEFDGVNDNSLYSVILVNPDTPDVPANSFKTSLHYGLCNISLNYVENTIKPLDLFLNPANRVFKEYVPLLPEKNAQVQRACLWVFRQERELSNVQFSSDNFDIRAFAQENALTAVGAHVWRQQFDRSVNGLREKYGLEKGRVFHRVRRPYPLANHDE